MERHISDIKENLSNAKELGKKCTLLVGAGCSAKAGIPLASDFVEIIKNDYENAYNRAIEKTYPACMAELHVGHRRDLIAGYIDNAKINWAHICIALLIHEGYVDRVFTTNFDPLLIKACALLNEFPAVYDFAASQLFKPADVADKAIFHLHGQRGGFVLLNTKEECNRFSNHLKPVFQDSEQGRMWIVIGYSGDNDPVFDHLAEINRFDYGLYWIGYKDNEPSEHLRNRLLVKDKGAYFVKGYDADSFFIQLTQKLKIFPPDFIGRPFTHLNNCFEMITPFALFDEEPESDVTHKSREQIKKCIDEYEKIPSLIQIANVLLLEGDYDGVVKMQSSYNKTTSSEFADVLSWGYIGQGNEQCDLAMTKEGDDAEKLFSLAFEKYEAALKIKPDKHEALYNWGSALCDLAKTKEGDDAEKLFSLAFEKYEAALKIKPDKHEALNNWGTTLSYLARMKEGKEAEDLLKQSIEKYEGALEIKPDKHEALYNWGTTLSDLAKMKKGKEAEDLLKQTIEKYEDTLEIKPDKHEVLNSWGAALLALAKMKEGKEAEDLLKQSIEKLMKAEEIKEGSAAYNIACVNSLIGEMKDSLLWLEKSLKLKYASLKNLILEDSDFDNIKATDDFNRLVNEYLPE